MSGGSVSPPRTHVGPTASDPYVVDSLVGQIPTEKDKFGHYRRRKLLYIPGVGAEAKGIPKYLAQVFGKTVGKCLRKTSAQRC